MPAVQKKNLKETYTHSWHRDRMGKVLGVGSVGGQKEGEDNKMSRV